MPKGSTILKMEYVLVMIIGDNLLFIMNLLLLILLSFMDVGIVFLFTISIFVYHI